MDFTQSRAILSVPKITQTLAVRIFNLFRVLVFMRSDHYQLNGIHEPDIVCHIVRLFTHSKSEPVF